MKNNLNIIKKRKFEDVYFWICLLFYYDPGGIQQLLSNGPDLYWRFDWTDLWFLILMIIYFFTKSKTAKYVRLPKALITFCIFWVLYYYIIVGIVIPQTDSINEIITMFFKTRDLLYAMILMIPVNYFMQRSLSKFLCFNQRITIIVTLLYLLTILFNVELVYVIKGFREFAGIERFSLQGLGFMDICLFFIIAVLILKLKSPSIQAILSGIAYAFILVMSVTRRGYIELLVYVVLLIFFKRRVFKTKPFVTKNLTVQISVVLGLILIFALNPKYFTSLKYLVSETERTLRGERTSSGWLDTRLSLKNDVILSRVKGKEIFGTGFDIKWYDSKEQSYGYETSDYPILASFAMLGYVGFILFSPFYVLQLYFFYIFYRYSKKKRKIIAHLLDTDKRFLNTYVLSLATLGLSIYHIVNYTYLFACSGTHPAFNTIYFYFAMFWASLNITKKEIGFYENENSILY